MASSETLADRLLISSQDEVSELARHLADDYIEYFDIDINHEQQCYQDSIEECLAHLEEVMSALDAYNQTSQTIDGFVGAVVSKDKSLKRLFGQVDAIEQYAYETNRLLNQMDAELRELERHQSLKEGKLKQLLHMIPGVSNLPRLGFFNPFGSLTDGLPAQDFVENQSEGSEDHQLTPISDIIHNLRQIDATLANVTTNLNSRLYEQPSEPSTELHEPMATLSLDSPENEDGSWQELL